MQVVDAIAVDGRPDRRVDLWWGDLTELAELEATDVLIVSAFLDDYTPTRDSMIGTLDASGLSVAELARDKDLDIRATHSCWLSKPLPAGYPGLRYRRILCFEPDPKSNPPDRVGDIFNALEWILAVRPGIKTAAMPLVAAGDMGSPADGVVRALLGAALPWLEVGLAIDRLSIAVRSEASLAIARDVFAEVKKGYTSPAAPLSGDVDFDVFISYSHQNKEAADILAKRLREIRSGIRIFLDREYLQAGMAWQEEIYKSVERSRYVVAMLSPDYLASKNCRTEFAIARLHGDRVNRRVLQPVYAYSADLPTRIQILQYFDAREGDTARLSQAAEEIVRLLD